MSTGNNGNSTGVGGTTPTPDGQGTPQGSQANTQQGNQGGMSTQPFDYDKLASMITGRQTATEDSVLREYFKKQGLSKEEMEQAISSFKQQKAAQTPDIQAIQQQLAQSQAAVQQAAIEKEAMVQALTLGIDIKTVPYVLRMTDLSNVVSTDGKVEVEQIKNAINATLEAVPQLKPQAQQQTGFVQVGANDTQKGQQQTEQSQLAAIFGNKK